MSQISPILQKITSRRIKEHIKFNKLDYNGSICSHQNFLCGLKIEGSVWSRRFWSYYWSVACCALCARGAPGKWLPLVHHGFRWTESAQRVEAKLTACSTARWSRPTLTEGSSAVLSLLKSGHGTDSFRAAFSWQVRLPEPSSSRTTAYDPRQVRLLRVSSASSSSSSSCSSVQMNPGAQSAQLPAETQRCVKAEASESTTVSGDNLSRV